MDKPLVHLGRIKNMNEQIFGWLSILLCLIGFGVQIHKLLFKKSIKSISLSTFSIAIVGSTFWSIHGLCAKAFHGGFENAIITFCSGIILFCSLRGKASLFKRIGISLPICFLSSTLGTMLFVNYSRPDTIHFSQNEIIQLMTGCIAGSLMGISFIPQVLKVIRTRDVKDISTFMCVFYGLAQVVLVVYWSSRSDSEIGEWLPGVIFCSCALSLQVSLLSLKIMIERPLWMMVKNKK